ncbi:hypothetical protein EV424DRAFT_1307630, partial [Suillus variegatus]
LRTLLLPSPVELHDTVCVIFAGSKQVPTRDTFELIRPVLVTRSRVVTARHFFAE